MHFITGGAFNGKRAWVKKTYQTEYQVWLSAYENQPLPQKFTDSGRNLMIVEGIELWLKVLLEQNDVTQARELWNTALTEWLHWEKETIGRNLVIIGTDISKGIVPLETENRLWRDLAGWAYQDTAAKACRVDVIWYGMNQTIKGGLLNENIY